MFFLKLARAGLSKRRIGFIDFLETIFFFI